VLRNQIGYKGLVVSDDLEMGGVLKAAPLTKPQWNSFAPAETCA
jgi:beta-glucosidase-like glycosyl hydrolase